MSSTIDRTKQHIIQTFFEMMADIGFEQIRVSNLAKKAGINRGTFYHHFVDKYEILEEIEGEIYNQFRLLMDKHVCFNHKTLKGKPSANEIQHLFQNTFLQIMLFLYERKDIATILVGKNGRPQFIEKLESLYCETVRRNIGAESQSDDYRTHYLQEFVFSGVISVIKCWLRNGAKETPEEVAKLLAVNLTTAPIKIFGDDFSV